MNHRLFQLLYRPPETANAPFKAEDRLATPPRAIYLLSPSGQQRDKAIRHKKSSYRLNEHIVVVMGLTHPGAPIPKLLRYTLHPFRNLTPARTRRCASPSLKASRARNAHGGATPYLRAPGVIFGMSRHNAENIPAILGLQPPRRTDSLGNAAPGCSHSFL